MGQNRDILITNGWLPAGPDSPFTLAMDRGFFQENGLNVTIERGAGSADALAKLAAGRYAFSKGDMYSMMEFNEKNPEVPLIAVVIESNRHPGGIFTLKKNGITDPKQLAGVKIGAPAGDGARRLWPVLAKIIGVDPESVEWVTAFATLPKHFEGADALDQDTQDTELTRLKYTIANYWDTPDTRANGVSAVDHLQRLQTSLAQVAEGYGLQRVPDASEILTTEFLPPKEARMFA